MKDCVRRSAVRAVSEWGQLLVSFSEGESKRYWSDILFEQLCSMVRDMSMVVRLEAFDARAKIEMVSEDILLLTLSKKVNKHIEIPAPSAVAAFVHGLEDEYYESFGRWRSDYGIFCFIRRYEDLLVLPCIHCILSADFACKALNLLVDVLNDDSIVVRSQALETMHHMAKFGHLKLQEAHVDMTKLMYFLFSLILVRVMGVMLSALWRRFLKSCSRSTFVSPSELFKEEEPLQQMVNGASRIRSQESWELVKIRSSHVDDQQQVNDVRKALVKLILANLNNIWPLIQFRYMAEVLWTLRSFLCNKWLPNQRT